MQRNSTRELSTKTRKWFRRNTNGLLFRLAPLFLLVLVWQWGSSIASTGTLPAPLAVMSVIGTEARSGALFVNLAITLARVAASFVLAMALGRALGGAMGPNKCIDRLCDPLLIVLLNLPALVVIVLAYIGVGLNEAAAIGAVVLNKF